MSCLARVQFLFGHCRINRLFSLNSLALRDSEHSHTPIAIFNVVKEDLCESSIGCLDIVEYK